MEGVNQALSSVGAPADDGEPQQILLVDDMAVNLQVLMNTLEHEGHKLAAANSGPRALDIAHRVRPDLVLLDVMMPEMDGYEVCRQMKADPELRDAVVIFCSALEDTSSKVKGFEVGGADFITKPFQPEEVVARVNTHLTLARVLRRLGQRNAELEREFRLASVSRAEALERSSAPLLGSSAAIKAVRAGIKSAAENDEPLLIVGEPYCGGESVARAIHAASDRKNRHFVSVDCASLLPGNQSHLFSQSAPSGTVEPGKFSLMNGGTLYLERVHRLPLRQQGELSRMLGETTEDRAAQDVRIIARASQLSEGSTFSGGFDSQLAQLLRRNALHLPELIERAGDIPDLVQHFVQLHSRRLGYAPPAISDETMTRLVAYAWPGNLRELEEVLRQSVESSQGGSFDVDPRLLQYGVRVGSYRLIRKLGSGAMGEVWEGTHQLLSRSAAIKLIKDSGEGPEAVERRRRFEREARVTANLTSLNTVELYDFGISEEGNFYYVMELLDGIDLRDAVSRFGPMPPARVADLLTQACGSLSEAHRAGLVHRDIKPANLFLCRQGLELDVLKVLDFGIVSESGDADATQLTAENAIAGTPSFVSPEGALGTAKLSGKSDIYSLGCAAYWLLTGQHVFEAPNTMALFMRHLTDTPTPPSQRGAFPIPEDLETLIMDCLAKEPDERPSALELWSALFDTGLPQQWSTWDAAAWWEENL